MELTSGIVGILPSLPSDPSFVDSLALGLGSASQGSRYRIVTSRCPKGKAK